MAASSRSGALGIVSTLVSWRRSMMDFFYLIPIALALGAVGLCAFMWSLTNGQYDDLDGAAERILIDDEM
jgi:cbb3-type cytochrome oxidase maturation protein